MDQHKVEIVSLELPKGFFPRSLCLFIAKLRYPNLCGEENILPANTQFLDSALNTFANFFFRCSRPVRCRSDDSRFPAHQTHVF